MTVFTLVYFAFDILRKDVFRLEFYIKYGFVIDTYLRGNNLRHQYGGMHIAATVSFHRISAQIMNSEQDKIFKRKRLSTGANFVHVYIEIRNKVY